MSTRSILVSAGAVLAAAVLLVCAAWFGMHGGKARSTNVAVRATIVDRDGVVLARTDPIRALWFNPRFSGGVLKEPSRQIAVALAKIFTDLKIDDLSARLASGRPGYLKRAITADQAVSVRNLGDPALQTPLELVRNYPNGSRAAHLIGFARDGAGRAGVEAAMNARLINPALHDQSLALSIRLPVQVALEDELSRGIAISHAKGAAGIVLDADTGEVVALASLPSFDPNAVGKAIPDSFLNRATGGVYEFGSAFMPITVATAIDAGVATDLARRYSSGQPLTVGKFEIRDRQIIAPTLTIPEALAHSSNVVMARIADEVGANQMKRTLQSMQMNKRLSVELPGRASPLWPAYWSRLTTMSVSYGYGIAVTPLHLASAYAAMINGGIWRPATVIKMRAGQIPPGRRIFKASTSERMRELLRATAAAGDGRIPISSTLVVGGMTGLAARLGPGDRLNDSLLATSVAAFPINRPRYVVLVALEEPRPMAEPLYQRAAISNIAAIIGRTIEAISPLLAN